MSVDRLLTFVSLKAKPPYEERVFFVCVKRKPVPEIESRYGRKPAKPVETEPEWILRTGILKSTGKNGHNFELEDHNGPSGYVCPVAWAAIPQDLPILDDIPTGRSTKEEDEDD